MEASAMDNRKRNKMIVSAALGAVAGFAVSFGLMRAIGGGYLGEIDTSRSLAAMMGAIYLLCAGFVGAGLLNPKLGARFLNVEDAEEIGEQSAMLRNSCFSVAAFGLSLVLLAIAAPLGPVPGPIVGGLIAVLMGLAVVASLRTFRQMDELNASLSNDTAVGAFYVLFFGAGGWSVAAHLGLVRALAPLDWLTLFGGSMLVAAFWAAGRRGLLVPR